MKHCTKRLYIQLQLEAMSQLEAQQSYWLRREGWSVHLIVAVHTARSQGKKMFCKLYKSPHKRDMFPNSLCRLPWPHKWSPWTMIRGHIWTGATDRKTCLYKWHSKIQDFLLLQILLKCVRWILNGNQWHQRELCRSSALRKLLQMQAPTCWKKKQYNYKKC